MARRLQVAYHNDFTGGLNLRTQRQGLAENETPDCMDVDFNARGGITLRRGYLNVTADSNLSTTAGYLVGQYQDLLFGVSNVGRLWTWDGSTATHVATAITSNTTSEYVRADQWNSTLHFANTYSAGTTLVMRTWNGTSFTTLGNTVNNNYTAPAGGMAPLARLVANHGGHMWWADTVEAGTRYRSRIRYSHPLQPGDFADADRFDIEPDDGDQITAIIPFRGQLMVFKRKAVYAMYGANRDDFIPERISATAGAWSQECVCTSQTHVFWWTPDGDILAYDGSTISSVGNKISTLVSDGTVAPGGDHKLAFAEGRLWAMFACTDGTRRTYVWDPRIGEGAWTRYNVPVTNIVWWRRSNGSNGVMARILGQAGVADWNRPSQITDFTATGTTVVIPGYYSTSWFFADDTALLKRWKRMSLTCSSTDEALMNVDVFYDFDESTVRKTLTAEITPALGSSLWGTMTWGTSLWGSTDLVFAFERLQSSGRGHAIKFKFRVTDHLGTWSLDSYALPFYQKAYR